MLVSCLQTNDWAAICCLSHRRAAFHPVSFIFFVSSFHVSKSKSCDLIFPVAIIFSPHHPPPPLHKGPLYVARLCRMKALPLPRRDVASLHRWLAQRFVVRLLVLYLAGAATDPLINCSYYFAEDRLSLANILQTIHCLLKQAQKTNKQTEFGKQHVVT